jgi:hypothetical protein
MRTHRGPSLALTAALAGCAPTPGTRHGASPTPGAIPAGTAAIEPGTYRIPGSAWSDVDFTVTFPEGWTV